MSRELNLRKRKPVNYSKLNAGRPQQSDESESSDEETLQLSTDEVGEKELCGSFNEEEENQFEKHIQEEDSEMEDGEVETEDSEEDEEVNECIQKGNLERLKHILKRRQNDCKTLKKEMAEERMKEKKQKEFNEVLEQIGHVNKTKKTLQRSLASSKRSSPASTPMIPMNKKKERKKSPTILSSKVTKKVPRKETKAQKGRTERSEYAQVFDSLMRLKQGNSNYSEIVANAMQATDNIFAMTGGNNESKVGQDAFSPVNLLGKHTKAVKQRGVKGQPSIGDNHIRGANSAPNASKNANIKRVDRADNLIEILDKFSNNKCNGPDIASALLAALERSPEGKHDPQVRGPETEPPPRKVMPSLGNHGNNVNNEGEKTQESMIKISPDSGSNKHDSSNSKNEKGNEEVNKKLTSGKCAKPDDSDIKLVVKYAHDKLDAKHVKERKFDTLPFHLLIAGELELIAAHCKTEEERLDRIQIAKTICYHKKYLNDEELRGGYENILQQVEQGKYKWGDGLESKLHEYLDYRANINLRDKLSAQQDGFTKVEYRKHTDQRNSNDTSGKDKAFYCMEYNLGTCPQHDHHEGRLGNRKVMKLHICRRCHRDGEIRSHREGDDKCTKRRS